MNYNANSTLAERQLVEDLARIIYCDSFTSYGTCSNSHWQKTSEAQRELCRGQALAVLNFMIDNQIIKKESFL